MLLDVSRRHPATRNDFGLSPPERAKHSARLTACLATVYLTWGLSFWFTKVGVSHLPAALMSGVRFTIAGSLLSGFAFLFRDQAWPDTRKEWRTVTVAGFLTVLLNTGLNVWSIQYMSSAESALLNATAALWIAVLGVFGVRGHALTRRAIAGLVLGAIGTFITLLPRLRGSTTHMLPYLAPLVASLSWSVATIYYRNSDTRLGSLMFIGLQMLTGGIMQVTIALALGESHRWEFNFPGITALAYLTIFSSCLAYTAYGWLTRNSTPAIVGTFSYVAPAIAAFAGWLFLGERLLPLQIVGMGVILLGVILVTLAGTQVSDPRTQEGPVAP
jgi:drug/metabolite transporter (DMT)-like permease